MGGAFGTMAGMGGVGGATTAMNIARLAPTAAVAGAAVIGLNNGAQFEQHHPWVSDDFDNIMNNSLVPESIKNEMWQQMQSDRLLHGARNWSLVAEQGNVLASIMIDPRFNRPSILSTPIPPQQPSILFTPDDREKWAELSRLPGFGISDTAGRAMLESFPIHQQDWWDHVFISDTNFAEFEHFKKKDGSERYECEKSQSPQWQKAKPYKDQFRTNGAKRKKDREYYRWDIKHSDVEVFDGDGCYVGSRDPVTGKMYRKGDMQVNEQLKRIIR